MKFHHELKAELKQKYKNALNDFDSKKNEYNILYDIASDYISTYPKEYHYLGENYLTLGISDNMSIEQFNDYLNYIETEYLVNYERVSNKQTENNILFMYNHKKTKNVLKIHFYHFRYKKIKTGKLIEETITKCTWGE